MEDAESQVAALSRVKTQLTQQLVERQAQTEQDARDRQALVLQVSNYLKENNEKIGLS